MADLPELDTAPPAPTPRPLWRTVLVGILQYGVSLGILAYLFHSASQDESFSALRDQPKQWGLLAVALLVSVTAVTLTFVRWWLLVRSLGIPFSLRDALRLGSLGFLFAQLSVGVLGGDAVKAVFIARQSPGRRGQAVATVVVDRLVGLYALFVVAAVASFAIDFSSLEAISLERQEQVRGLTTAARVLALVGTVTLLVFLLPGFTNSALSEMLQNLPVVGGAVTKVVAAVRVYRRNLGILVSITAMSLLIHLLYATSVFLIARGIPGGSPSLSAHFVVVPLSILAGSVPLPGGLGAMELALDFLYQGVAPAGVAARQGFVVALGYRLVIIATALIGAIYFLIDKRRGANAELENDAADPHKAPPTASTGESADATSTKTPAGP